MCATLVSKVGLSCELALAADCWAVPGDSSAVTGVPFLAGEGGRSLPFCGNYLNSKPWQLSHSGQAAIIGLVGQVRAFRG
jgi:hypothetical protein